MPVFSYYAKSLKGEEKRGILEAKDEKELYRILREDGFILISAKNEEAKEKKKGFNIPLLSKVSLKDKLFFTKNLQVMIASGVSLPKALKILSLQTKNKKFREVLSEIRKKLIKGENFSQCLSYYPDIFSELFINMIKVGEETGNLEGVLENLSAYMERDYELRSRVKGAMLYPLVILVAMAGIGILMLIFVVPKLSETFETLGVPLPFTTRLVFSLGNFLLNYWYSLAIFIIPVIYFILFRKKKKRSKSLDKLLLKVPIISNILREINTAYTARTLSALISSGVPLVLSLKITSKVVDNSYFREVIDKSAERVQKGEKLSEAIGELNKEMNLYPLVFIQMLQVGEETGETSEILKKLAEFFEREVENTTKNLSSIIEPILILMIGGAVGFFAVSIIQPIYSIMGSI